MLPVSLIFSSGVASGVNSYAVVLVLGLLGRFGHIAAIPTVLERPSVLAAALGGGSALVSHVVKTGTRIGVNASPEPFSNIVASLLEDLGVVSLVSYAVFHPVVAAIVAAVGLTVGVVLFALLASRIRRGWQRRRDARLRRRSSGGRVAAVPSPQR